jgi:hypothetical protein
MINTPEQVKEVKKLCEDTLTKDTETMTKLIDIISNQPTKESVEEFFQIAQKHIQKTLSDYNRDDLAFLLSYDYAGLLMKELALALLKRIL